LPGAAQARSGAPRRIRERLQARQRIEAERRRVLLRDRRRIDARRRDHAPGSRRQLPRDRAIDKVLRHPVAEVEHTEHGHALEIEIREAVACDELGEEVHPHGAAQVFALVGGKASPRDTHGEGPRLVGQQIAVALLLEQPAQGLAGRLIRVRAVRDGEEEGADRVIGLLDRGRHRGRTLHRQRCGCLHRRKAVQLEIACAVKDALGPPRRRALPQARGPGREAAAEAQGALMREPELGVVQRTRPEEVRRTIDRALERRAAAEPPALVSRAATRECHACEHERGGGSRPRTPPPPHRGGSSCLRSACARRCRTSSNCFRSSGSRGPGASSARSRTASASGHSPRTWCACAHSRSIRGAA